MPYDREYSLSETRLILDVSENRQRPDRPANIARTGHAYSLHTRARSNVFARPAHNNQPANLPATDSIFFIPRLSLVPIIHEVLNSPPGQRGLRKLNQQSKTHVALRSVILRQGSEFDIFTVFRPSGGGQTSFEWLSTTQGDGYIVQVFVLVVKVPGANEEIHIQTAYPEDYARTDGDDIVL